MHISLYHKFIPQQNNKAPTHFETYYKLFCNKPVYSVTHDKKVIVFLDRFYIIYSM